MNEKPTHSGSEENGFKKPDRADRHGKHIGEDSKNRQGFAPNPNDDSHKPKIVPWK